MSFSYRQCQWHFECRAYFFLVFVYIVLLSRVKAKNISFGEALRFVGPDGDPDSESQWVTCLLCQIHVFIFRILPQANTWAFSQPRTEVVQEQHA